MVNFYNRFIPHAAHLMRPLFEALKEKKDSKEVAWSLEQVWAFEVSKAVLADTVMLAHLSPAASIAQTTDALGYAVQAVCKQRVAVAWHPLAFLH